MNPGAAEFAEIARRSLEAEGWVVEDVDDGVIRAHSPDGEEHQLSFHNLHPIEDESTEEAVARWLTLLAADADEPPLQSSQVVPAIKDHGFLVDLRQAGMEVAFDPLCGELWVVYMQDLPHAMRLLTEDELSEVGFVGPERVDRAMINLLPQLKVEQHAIGEGAYMLTCGGNFEASLLLAMGLWHEVAEGASGDVIATAPARDLVFFTHTGSEAGLSAVAGALAKARQTPDLEYPLDSGLMRFTDRGWEAYVYEPPVAAAESREAAVERWVSTVLAQLALGVALPVLSWRLVAPLGLQPSTWTGVAAVLPLLVLNRVWAPLDEYPWRRPTARRVQFGCLVFIAAELVASGAHMAFVEAARQAWSWPLWLAACAGWVAESFRLWKGDGYLWNRPWTAAELRASR